MLVSKKNFWMRRRVASPSTKVVCHHGECHEVVLAISDEESYSSETSERSLLSAADCERQEVPSTVELTTTSQNNDEFRLKQAAFKREPVDVEAYMARREMTAQQEKWNALTMLPQLVYCLYFLFSAPWLLSDNSITEEMSIRPQMDVDVATRMIQMLLGGVDEFGCMLTPTTWMSAVPPTSLVVVILGVCLHSPLSFIYHWFYAHSLPPGAARASHWSRRFDQSFIHVTNLCAGFGLSRNPQFLALNTLFNVDSFLQHFLYEKVRPRSNQLRILMSIFLSTSPIIWIEPALFVQVWVVFSVAFFVFAAYPFGGWSHSLFHLLLALPPPLILMAVLQVEQDSIDLASWCVAQQS